MDSAALFSDGTKGCGYFPKSEGGYRCPKENNVLGICPEGWHLPSLDDHNKLMQNVKDMHLLLAATGEWFDAPLNTDKFGFALLPGGDYCSINDSPCPFFDELYMVGTIWLASENGSKYADALIGSTMILAGESNLDGLGVSSKYVAMSIRCIKD